MVSPMPSNSGTADFDQMGCPELPEDSTPPSRFMIARAVPENRTRRFEAKVMVVGHEQVAKLGLKRSCD